MFSWIVLILFRKVRLFQLIYIFKYNYFNFLLITADDHIKNTHFYVYIYLEDNFLLIFMSKYHNKLSQFYWRAPIFFKHESKTVPNYDTPSSLQQSVFSEYRICNVDAFFFPLLLLVDISSCCSFGWREKKWISQLLHYGFHQLLPP